MIQVCIQEQRTLGAQGLADKIASTGICLTCFMIKVKNIILCLLLGNS